MVKLSTLFKNAIYKDAIPVKNTKTVSIGGILCVWRRGIGKYYLNSEKLGFQYGPRAAGPRSVLNPNFEE